MAVRIAEYVDQRPPIVAHLGSARTDALRFELLLEHAGGRLGDATPAGVRRARGVSCSLRFPVVTRRRGSGTCGSLGSVNRPRFSTRAGADRSGLGAGRQATTRRRRRAPRAGCVGRAAATRSRPRTSPMPSLGGDLLLCACTASPRCRESRACAVVPGTRQSAPTDLRKPQPHQESGPRVAGREPVTGRPQWSGDPHHGPTDVVLEPTTRWDDL